MSEPAPIGPEIERVGDARLEKPVTAVRAVVRSPLYRRSTIALFLSGLGASAVAPQIALFLVRDLHASYAVAGLYYLTNLAAPVAGYLIGSRSDRTGSRLGLFRICTLVGFAGWLLIGLSMQVWLVFIISFVLLGFAGVAGSLLFSAIHDQGAFDRESRNDSVVAIARMALTAGWIVGPILGAYLGQPWGIGSRCSLPQRVVWPNSYRWVPSATPVERRQGLVTHCAWCRRDRVSE